MPKKKIILFYANNFDNIATADQFYKVLGKNDICQCRVKDKKSASNATLLKFIITAPISKDLKDKILEDKRADPLFNNPEICHEKEIIHRAIATEINEKSVAKMIKGADLTIVSSEGGITPLQGAAGLGNVSLVKLLIESKGAAIPSDINQAGISGNTPLHCAVLISSSLETVKIILEAKPNINQTNHNGCTPLLLAVEGLADGSLEKCVFDMAKIMLDAKADPTIADKNGITPLSAAINCQKHTIVNLLSSSTATLEDLNDAIKNDDEKSTKKLLELKVNPTKLSGDLIPPLFMALERGNFNLVKILLERKADPNQQYTYKVESDLYSPNDSIFLPRPTKIRDTAFHAALFHINSSTPDIIRELIKYKGDPNIKNSEGVPPIIRATSKQYEPNIVQTLLEVKANPELTEDGRDALLITAAGQGNLKLFQSILASKKNFHIQDIGASFSAALMCNYENVANYILDTMPQDINDQDYIEQGLFFILFRDMNNTTLEKMLNKIKIDFDRNFLPNDCNILHHAVYLSRIESIKTLIEHKADPNILSSQEGTALHIAAKNKRIDIVKILVENKADPTIKRQDGKTPFELLPYDMKMNSKIAKLFGVTIDHKSQTLQPLVSSVTLNIVDNFAEVIKEYQREAKKRMLRENFNSIPTIFNFDEKETKKITSFKEHKLNPLTLSHLCGDTTTTHAYIIKNKKPVFIILHPSLKEDMEKNTFNMFNEFIQTGHCKFLGSNSEDQQGVKFLKMRIKHPISGKPCPLYEIKLSSISGRIFGVIEKINNQQVFCGYDYAKNPHKNKQAIREAGKKIKNCIVKRSHSIQEKEQNPLKQNNFRI